MNKQTQTNSHPLAVSSSLYSNLKAFINLKKNWSIQESSNETFLLFEELGL